MGRERADSITARIPARIQSALAEAGRRREERRLSHEAGVDIDATPQDQEIVLFECLDTKVFNQSVVFEEDPRLRVD